MTHLWRLLKLLKPHLGLMLLGALLSLITVLANISLLAVSGWFITLMAIGGLTGITVNYFTPAAIIRFLAIVRTAGRYTERLLTHRATFNALAELRYYFYRKLEPLLPSYRVQFQSGDILARMQQDIDQLDNFYLRVLLPLLVALFAVPLVCWGLSLISLELALTVLMALLFVGIVLPAINYLVSRSLARQQTHLGSRLKLELIDGIAAMRELLVYQVAAQYQSAVSQLSERYHNLELRLHRFTALTNAITFLVVNLTLLASLYLLVPLLQGEQLSREVIPGIALLVLVCFETVMSLPLAMQILPQTLASAGRLFEITDKPVPTQLGGQKVTEGAICFNQLDFSYPEQSESTIKGIDLQINPGEKVAIIGASGAGKSTLVNLLMGFWPTPADGVTINGIDLNQLSATSLRKHIALMSQQGHLFHATLADNLRLANPQATQEQMLKACKSAGLLDFINDLELGLDTWLGETGTGLSGGQAQRLQLAQALLRPARVLVLDEPTKGLDRRNEQRLVAELLTHVEANEQSLVLITHKPLMLQKMDKIVVMDEGRIIAQGSHQELLASNDYYRQLISYF